MNTSPLEKVLTEPEGNQQCSKLRVYPAPGVHNLAVGCTHFGTCAPGECTIFQSVSMQYVGLCTTKIC